MFSSPGENPEDAVQAARNNYLEFSFSGGDLRDKLGKGGAKEGVKSTKPRDPVPHKDFQPMKTDQEVSIIDLRDRITGKQAPAKLELTTKIKPVSKPAVTDVRLKDQKEAERNERWKRSAYFQGQQLLLHLHHPHPGRRQTPASPHHILELGRPLPTTAQVGGGPRETEAQPTPATGVRRTRARQGEDQGFLQH